MNRDDILNMSAGREMDALIAEKVMGHYLGNTRDIVKILPHYSTDIVAAWGVTEKFRCMRLTRVGMFWFCDLSVDGKESSQSRYEYSQSKTAPLAICRAALLATL